MKDLMRKHPRWVGTVFLLIGIGLAISLKHTYDTGDGVREKTIIAVPFTLLWGMAILVRPRLMLLDGDFAQAPLQDKVTLILIAVVGVGLGILLRQIVFGDWQ